MIQPAFPTALCICPAVLLLVTNRSTVTLLAILASRNNFVGINVFQLIARDVAPFFLALAVLSTVFNDGTGCC